MLSLFIRKDKIQTAWLYFLPSLTGGKKKGPARCGKRGAADRGKTPIKYQMPQTTQHTFNPTNRKFFPLEDS